MGKKNKSSTSLGRSLINDRFGSANKGRRAKDSSLLHTAEVNDGYDWGRLNLQSVTEENSFQEFLSTAELAGTEFQSEKLNITFVNPLSGASLLTENEQETKETQEKNRFLLGIPRRPKWNPSTTPEELQQAEQDSFLDWRRRLAVLSEVKGIFLTPYEKNLEFWRQLWRVVERSDVVVQIVDARNPLLFHCEDLEQYVKEVSHGKLNMVLLNKADFLTDEQRGAWARYFDDQGIRVAFFSAILPEDDENDDGKFKEPERKHQSEHLDQSTEIEAALEEVSIGDRSSPTLNVSSQNENSSQNDASPFVRSVNSSALLNREELIVLFKSLHHGAKVTKGMTTIGLVGYPNVGKSSTINALMTQKKVSVSATPGKTKHFQTLFLDKELQLCDCPGLVMPSFLSTKAEMITSGILPIDQMRDHVPPIALVAKLVPRHVFQAKYGLMLPPPREEEDQNRPPTSQELCNAYGYNRGFMTQNGMPDNPRSARYILKDFVNGKLLYCHSPPGVSQDDYHQFPTSAAQPRVFPPVSSKMLKSHKLTGADLDKMFFAPTGSGVHKKGVERVTTGDESTLSASCQQASKPWKDHSSKRNKKEKLRRIYSHLDA